LDDAEVSGSAVVPTAVFGVSPKTLSGRRCSRHKPEPNSERTGWRDSSQSDREVRTTDGLARKSGLVALPKAAGIAIEEFPTSAARWTL
jgi:hypothetical protein